MKKNNLLLPIIAFFLTANTLEIHTQDKKNDNNSKTTITLNENESFNNDDQHNQDVWKSIEETFQSVTSQTQSIEYCLQQIELIINADKIKFDNKKASKKYILQEIKEIKHIIQFISDFYTKQLSKDEVIVKGTFFNAAFMNYLLPLFRGNITEISAENFDKAVMQNFDEFMNSSQSQDELFFMIQENTINLELLKEAGDNVGLSMIHKAYRFLDTKPLPLYGKSTISAVQDVAFWGACGLVAYSIPLYVIPRNTSIYGTWKEYTAESDDTKATTTNNTNNNRPEDVESSTNTHSEKTLATETNNQADANGTAKAPATQPKKAVKTWKVDGKEYTNWTVQDIPGKSFLGDRIETNRSLQPMNQEDLKKAEDNFGVYSHLHLAKHAYDDVFIKGLLGLLGASAMPHLKEMYKNAKTGFDSVTNYYLKGDANPLKSSSDVPKVYFKDMIGGEHLEKLAYELADYLKNPTRYERAGISPSTGYLLAGPAQTGKSFFAKALKTLIDDQFKDKNEKVKFANITAEDLQYSGGFTNIFNWARTNAPIILFIDEIDMHKVRRDLNAKNTQELLTSMNGMETDPSKKVIVIAATNKPEELDFALKQKGRLGNVITFDLPSYECRKKYLEKQLDKKNITLSSDMVDTIAQETDKQTYNMIDDIVRQALQLATFQTRPVTEADFETTLDREIRKIKPNATMSAQEKELIAIYQAGQAVARHILTTDQQIVKITIDTVDKAIKSNEGFGIVSEQKGQNNENHDLTPSAPIKSTRLGFVFTMSKTNNHELVSDEEQETELMALLAGQAALELTKGKTFNSFGKEDRAKVLESLGNKIAQGSPITESIRQKAIVEKDALYQKVKRSLKGHLSFVKTITDELLKTSTIDKKQWAQLSANYKV